MHVPLGGKSKNSAWLTVTPLFSSASFASHSPFSSLSQSTSLAPWYTSLLITIILAIFRNLENQNQIGQWPKITNTLPCQPISRQSVVRVHWRLPWWVRSEVFTDQYYSPYGFFFITAICQHKSDVYWRISITDVIETVLKHKWMATRMKHKFWKSFTEFVVDRPIALQYNQISASSRSSSLPYTFPAMFL